MLPTVASEAGANQAYHAHNQHAGQRKRRAQKQHCDKGHKPCRQGAHASPGDEGSEQGHGKYAANFKEPHTQPPLHLSAVRIISLQPIAVQPRFVRGFFVVNS